MASFTSGAVSQYAGDFECSLCRRKRLTAASFSKSMAAKYRADPSALIKCIDCVASQKEQECRIAAEKAASLCTSSATGDQVVAFPDQAESRECCACQRALPATSFSAKQRRKAVEESRCTECVAAREAEDMRAGSIRKLQALQTAQEHAQDGNSGPNCEKLHVLTAESAAEAEYVTGLKPIRIGRGRGGSWRARGRAGRVTGRTRGS
jgi:Stc1 domain